MRIFRNGRPTPRANEQACFKSTLTATSSEAGKMTVAGTFIHYKDVDSFGIEYKLQSAAEWTQKADTSSTVGTVAMELSSLTEGATYDVRMYWKIAGISYPMGDAVTCTVASTETNGE